MLSSAGHARAVVGGCVGRLGTGWMTCDVAGARRSRGEAQQQVGLVLNFHVQDLHAVLQGCARKPCMGGWGVSSAGSAQMQQLQCTTLNRPSLHQHGGSRLEGAQLYEPLSHPQTSFSPRAASAATAELIGAEVGVVETARKLPGLAALAKGPGPEPAVLAHDTSGVCRRAMSALWD